MVPLESILWTDNTWNGKTEQINRGFRLLRSSIVGGGGIAQEVRQELTQLFEKAVIEEDLSDSVQRYQEAIENSHVKLDFAVSPGVWFLPSNLEINLNSRAGYNNFLQKATAKMKLGVNKVNEPTPVEKKNT